MKLEDVFTPEQVQALEEFVGKKSDTPKTFWDDCPNFSRKEFICKCGGKHCAGDTAEPGENLVRGLQKLRNATNGRPVIISSGIRCPKHNAAVGGVYNSHHLEGTAADFAVSGWRSDTTMQTVKNLGVSPKEMYAIDSAYVHITIL